MTREEFIKVLGEEGYSHEIDGDKIIVDHNGRVDLSQLTSLPASVQFKNNRSVDLGSIISIPPDVKFSNSNVWLPCGWFHKWSGNIDGIDHTRLFNFMISKGLFEK